MDRSGMVEAAPEGAAESAGTAEPAWAAGLYNLRATLFSGNSSTRASNDASGGTGGAGGGAGDGDGGGLSNSGTASFIGVTVNFTSNVAISANGGNGGEGGAADSGFAGNGAAGGRGGDATGGAGGDGGFSSFGIGGGIHNANNASLVINPRLHAKKRSSQSKATIDFTTITGNLASSVDNDVDGTVSS